MQTSSTTKYKLKYDTPSETRMIPNVSNIPNIIEYQYSIPKIYQDASGFDVIQKDTYTVTVYDHKGTIKTVTNRTTVDLII